MPKNSHKHSTVTLSVFSLPLLFVAALLLAAGTGLFTATQKQLSAKHVASSVLSDEDSKESDTNNNEDSKDSEDSHDTEDNNKDNEDSNDNGMTEAQKKAAEAAQKAAERAREQQKKQAELQKRVASPTSILPKDNEDENEVENETEASNEKTEVVSTVKNDDGTITRTIKKTEDNGKFEMKEVTIALDGKVIKEVELKSDGTPKETENENENGDQNGDTNEVRERERTRETSQALQPVVVGFPVQVKVNGANLSNPSVLNKIRVEINKQIKEMPDVEGKVSKVELEAQTENGEYKGLISKDERLFGLFTVSVPVEVTVDPNTGNVTVSDQTFWSKFLDALSF